MKYLNFLLLSVFFCSMAFAQAPVFEDNFDSYVAGDQLACQNPTDWTTWSEDPCNATEDPVVSDVVSSSTSNSVHIVTNNDCVKTFASNYTTGYYKVSFMMYVETGFDGYFNTLQDFAGASSSWGMQAYFPSDGNGHVDAGGADAAFFSFPFDTWFPVEVHVDLDNDFGELYIDGTFIVDWQWSTGAFGTNSLNQLSASNFYGNPETTGASYYIDDYALIDMNAPPVSSTFMDDFDSYNAGEQLACQNPTDWTTWSNDPCNATEDAYVSDAYAFSGSNSTVIVQNNDLVKLHGEKTSGTWYMSMMVYIPAGKAGYFNAMSGFTPNPFQWAMECYFDAGGAARLIVDQQYDFTWMEDTWQQVVLMVDLDNDQATFWMGTNDPLTEIATWQWTRGGSVNLQLDANDFFGATADDEMYFDNYYFGDEPPTIVPVELTSFTANVVDANVQLNWSTATETNNMHFEIERRVADGEYVSIAYVDGAGTTTEEQHYTYTDREMAPGTYTYRLKQVDFGGTFAYSDPVEVEVEAPLDFVLNQNYPNPFNPSTVIKYSVPEAGHVTLSVYNVLGQEVSKLVNGTKAAGRYEVSFDASNLPSGAYFYKLESGSKVEIKKMMLTK